MFMQVDDSLRRSCCAWVALFFFSCLAQAQENSVVARIDNEVISRREAEYELQRIARGKEIPAEMLPTVRAAVLQQLIDQRLVLRQLAAMQRVASEQDIEQAVMRLEAVLKTRNQKLDDYLQQAGLSPAELKQQYQWQLSWERYLNEKTTPENLQKIFEKFRPQFDGTQRRVAHILWKVDPQASPEEREKQRQQAQAVQQKIVNKELDFAAAARNYSQAPSAESGGDIGWIQRHEPMPEAFSKAVFELPTQTVSAPVQTAFGWHLIVWTEEKPGSKTWQEVEPELRVALAQYLLEYHAAQERKQKPAIWTSDDWLNNQ